jgi:regulator of protease activity HflC (stomatin/prohibitin superfamily)
MGEYTNKIAKKAGLGAAAAGLFAFMTCVDYVKPYENGVKQTKIEAPLLTGKQGYEQKVYPGGKWYWVWPVLQTMHTFPRDVQALNFSKSKPSEDEQQYMRTVPVAKIQTSDTFQVDMEATVFYRITNPYLTVSKAGPGKLYDAVLDRYVEPALRGSLGESQPEDFFQIDKESGKVKRITAQELAKSRITADLKAFGMVCDDVRIRQTDYVSQVQEKFEKKSEEDQRVRTRSAQAKLEGQKAEFAKIKETGLQAAAVRKGEGDAYRAEKGGQVEAYKQTKESEGDKMVAMASAEATRLENDAYQGPGSQLLVGLEMAKNVCSLERIIWPVCGNQGNALDLENMTKLLSGQKR